MIGRHGTPGAPRVGAVVLSGPIRRVLVLGGLLLVALAAVWLAAAPVQAEERPAPGTGVLADVGQDLQQGAALEASGLHEPLTDTVAGAGGHAIRAVVRETSDHLPVDTGTPEPTGIGEATQRVHDDVYTAVENLPGGHRGTGPVREDAPAPEGETARDGGEGVPRPHEAAPSGSPPQVEEAVSAPEPAPAEAVAGPVDESPDTGDTAPATGSGSGAGALSSPAVPTALTHGVAPGYLSAPGAPAPAPGEIQAARHVLRSVPAAPEDETAFSPD
ncbi:hypothetical protein [Nocardiopsis kunsanensis]|uniref:hypothetical protein n=1 Tax=Nocardiopsis kunsanensis TaxID=141693 RepID=UPI000348F51E|nr:hypothetical protein [Nocardiopsis kunsanensis]